MPSSAVICLASRTRSVLRVVVVLPPSVSQAATRKASRSSGTSRTAAASSAAGASRTGGRGARPASGAPPSSAASSPGIGPSSASGPIELNRLLAMPNLLVSASACGISGSIRSMVSRIRAATSSPISPWSSRKSTRVRAAAMVSGALSGGAMTFRG